MIELPCTFEQLSSMNNQINSKHPCKHAFSFFFCLFVNNLFSFLSFPFWHKEIWTEFINMVAVEASVMSLVCWNLKVFLQCGLSQGKRRKNLLGFSEDLRVQWYVKVIKKPFACQQNLDLSSWIACNPIFQCALASGLILRPYTTAYMMQCDVSLLKHMM